MSREYIESNRVFFVRRIDQDNVVKPVFRDNSKNPINEVAVWIKNAYAFTVLNVLKDAVKSEGGLSRARGTDHVHVPGALVGG